MSTVHCFQCSGGVFKFIPRPRRVAESNVKELNSLDVVMNVQRTAFFSAILREIGAHSTNILLPLHATKHYNLLFVIDIFKLLSALGLLE